MSQDPAMSLTLFPCSPPDPLDINPSVDFLFDCGLVGPEDVSADQDLPRAIRKVSSAPSPGGPAAEETTFLL